MSLKHVQQIADTVGGRIESVGRLPDGSGFATVSFPLPKDHWLTRPGYNEPPMPFRLGMRWGWQRALRRWLEGRIMQAARYAIRASTLNGANDDFDPDAMAKNFITGLLGYYTHDGKSHI